MSLPPRTRITLLDGFGLWPEGAGPAAEAGDLPLGTQRLIATLCLSGRPARAAVAGQLWPDLAECQAHGSLRSALWRLQKSVPGLIEASGGALSLARDVAVDVRELREWARAALDPCTGPERVRLLDDPFPGELLPGWYDDWVLFQREQLRQLRMHALEALARKLTAAGQHGSAVQAAYAAVRLEPLRESAHRAVIGAHLAEGNVTEAVRAYEAFRAILAEELGVGPTAQMEELVRRIPRPRGIVVLTGGGGPPVAHSGSIGQHPPRPAGGGGGRRTARTHPEREPAFEQPVHQAFGHLAGRDHLPAGGGVEAGPRRAQVAVRGEDQPVDVDDVGSCIGSGVGTNRHDNHPGDRHAPGLC